MVAVELVKEVIIRSGTEVTFTGISSALNAILSIDTEDRKEFLDVAGETIDTYLTRDSDNSLFAEPAFLNTFNGDLNGFLKWEQFGKSDNAAPMLRQLLSIQKTVMGRRIASQDSLRERLVRLIK